MKDIKIPAPPEAPESVLKALKNKGNVQCTHCKKPLDLNDIKIINPRRASVKCANCSVNNFLVRTITARGLNKSGDGSLHRVNPKKKMSKKDRKRQKAIEKGWA